jgi:aspartate beta-hydroxylase
MATGGYLERVKERGAELERWHDYLQQISRHDFRPGGDPMVQPTIFPMMDGLSSDPWRDPSRIPAAGALERSIDIIRGELESFDTTQFVRYPSVIIASGRWTVLPLFVFGADVARLLFSRNPFPRTAALIESLPDACSGLPLADSIYSAHAPGTHLAPHCSWDPFRLRLHLGVRIPKDCRIRVGRETREWTNGKVLAFHDSHEHETWNDSNSSRIVLIVDVWHPALTSAERTAILAGFRKSEVRSQLMKTRAPVELQAMLDRQFAESDRHDRLLQEFWAG